MLNGCLQQIGWNADHTSANATWRRVVWRQRLAMGVRGKQAFASDRLATTSCHCGPTPDHGSLSDTYSGIRGSYHLVVAFLGSNFDLRTACIVHATLCPNHQLLCAAHLMATDCWFLRIWSLEPGHAGSII